MFENLLHPVLYPFLRIGPFLGILILSFIISLLITIVYKYMTDQTMMKDLKMRQKEFQKKLKELKGQPEKQLKVQKEAMDVNMKYMMQSFKPTIVTFIPIILIFSWMNAHLAYEPILPEQEFNVTLFFKEGASGNAGVSVPDGVEVTGGAIKRIENGAAVFNFRGKEGDYLLVFEHEGIKYEKELTISKERNYATPDKLFKEGAVSLIKTGNKKLIVVNLFGKQEGGFFSGRIGWLGMYIILSIVFSLGLRKVLKIY
jgi:uncharacterized membrane protein (DUF106 family)